MTLLFVSSLLASTASGEITFEEVSERAGISTRLPTAGASWGDLNSDGWPDLWVSNHHLHPPSLYLNLGEGRFKNIAPEALVGARRADFHGAAWADFDNDGDQDLLVLTGGGGGRGQSPNSFYENEDGRFTDRAREQGLDYPLGRGRTPLWFDADQDGLLDVLVVNTSRPDKSAPSAIFIQTPIGFEERNSALGFNSGRRSRFEKIRDLFRNALDFRLDWNTSRLFVSFEFAQLADLSDDRRTDLVAFVQPARIFSVHDKSLAEITRTVLLPHVDHIQDVALADFNGDARLDVYLARASLPPSAIVRTTPHEMRLSLVNPRKAKSHSKSVTWQSRESITFAFYTPWRDPTDPLRERPLAVFVGSRERSLTEPELTVAPDDSSLSQELPPKAREGQNISITFDRKSNVWTLSSSLPSLNVIVRSTTAIENIEPQDFQPSNGGLQDNLLLRNEDGFETGTLHNGPELTPCPSVAAGDFDNDMDIDLYLVCTGPVTNLPNLLYANQGDGTFAAVPGAGGAAGSRFGRGNQVAVADYDRDGFLDLFVTNGAGPPPFSWDGPHQLFHNRGNANHWLEVDLQGVQSNRDGIGATVTLETAGITQIRHQGGGMHSFSQDHQRIHFGLGPHTKVDTVVIEWPSGITQHLQDIAADQILRVVESDGATMAAQH